MKYSADDIVINNWAKPRQTSDGKWERIWKIVLKNPVSEGVDLSSISKNLSYIGWTTSVEMSEGKYLKVKVTVDEWNWSSHTMAATYKMFEEINQLLGTIDTIQDQDRNLWYPWLAGKAYLEGKFRVLRVALQEVEIGLRFNLEQGLSFYGINEVNDMLARGASVCSIEPGGAITRQHSIEEEKRELEIIGFCLKVTLEVSNMAQE